MTRFQNLLVLVALLEILAIATGSLAFGLAVAVALLVVVGLGVAFPQMRLFGPCVCRGNFSRKSVALTFDDGPDAKSTPALLDLLRDERVQVAFFCVGQRVSAEPEIARRIVNEGHLLENHSFVHSNFTNFFGRDRLKAEMQRTQETILSAVGVPARFFRPPMGLTNPRVFQAARVLDLQVIGWSARGLDTVTSDPDKVVARILRRARPGAILLLHDGNIPAARLVLTVKRLLASLREREYEIVRLDQLLK